MLRLQVSVAFFAIEHQLPDSEVGRTCADRILSLYMLCHFQVLSGLPRLSDLQLVGHCHCHQPAAALAALTTLTQLTKLRIYWQAGR